MAKKLESKFWQEVKQNTPGISWTRLESWASAGVPDLLGYNKKGHFFTVELKVTRRNFVTFSPHQISFHSRHPQNSFILVKHLGHGCLKLVPGSMLACLLDEGFACLSVDRARWSTVLESLLACWSNACVLLAFRRHWPSHHEIVFRWFFFSCQFLNQQANSVYSHGPWSHLCASGSPRFF